MKKISYLILMLVFSFLLVGCDISFGKKPTPNPDDNGGGGGEVKPDRPDKPELDYDFFVEKYEFTVLKEKQTLLVKVDHNDGIFILDLIRSKGCKIEGFYFDYELSKRIQDYEIKVQEGMPIFMNVNVDSTGKFDVWVINFIFGELPNPGPNPGPDIPNIEFKEETKLNEWQVVYKLNEPFAGGSLIHTYAGSEFKYEIIDITEDMIKGFDTKTPGDKKVSIKYRNLTLEASITVLKSVEPTIPTVPTDPIKPNDLNRQNVEHFAATLMAIMSTGECSGTIFEEEYNRNLEDKYLMNLSFEAIRLTGFTDNQVNNLTNILTKEYGPKYANACKASSDPTSDHFSPFLDKEFISIYKKIVNELTDVQLFMIVPIILNNSAYLVDAGNPNVPFRYVKLTIDEIRENIKNIDASIKKAFETQYETSKKKLSYIGLLDDKENRYAAKLFKEVVTDLLNATENDISKICRLLNALGNGSGKMSTYEMLLTFKPGFNGINNILNLTNKDSLINLVKLITNLTVKHDLVHYKQLEAVKDNVEAAYNSIGLMNNIFTDLSENDNQIVTKAFGSYLDDGHIDRNFVEGLVIFSKPVMKNYRLLDQTKKNLLNNFILNLTKGTGITLKHVEAVFDLFEKCSKLDNTNLTEKDVKEVINDFYNIQTVGSVKYLVYNGEETIILNNGATMKDLINKLVTCEEIGYYFYNLNPTMIKVCSFTPGINKAVLHNEKTTMEVYYYVKEAKVEEGRYILLGNGDEYSDYIFVFKKGAKDFLRFVPEEVSGNYNPYLVNFQLLDTKYNIPLNLSIDLSKYDFSNANVDTTKAGINTTVLRIDDKDFGTFYLPLTYFVADGSKIITSSFIQTYEKYIMKGTTDKVIGSLSLTYNYGITIKNINGTDYITKHYADYEEIQVNIKDVKGIDVNTVGKQKGTYTYNGVTTEFEIDIIDENSLNNIVNIYAHCEKPILKDKFTPENVIFEVETYKGQSKYTYQEFLDTFTKLNYKLDFKAPAKLAPGYNQVKALLSLNGKVKFEFKIDVERMTIEGDNFSIDVFVPDSGQFLFTKNPNINDLAIQVPFIYLSSYSQKLELSVYEFIDLGGKIEFDTATKNVKFQFKEQIIEYPYIIRDISDLQVYFDPDLKFNIYPGTDEIIKRIKYFTYKENGKLITVDDQDRIYKYLYNNIQIDEKNRMFTINYLSLTFTSNYTCPMEGYELSIRLAHGIGYMTFPIEPTVELVASYIDKVIITKFGTPTEITFKEFIDQGGTVEFDKRRNQVVLYLEKYGIFSYNDYSVDPYYEYGNIDVKFGGKTHYGESYGYAFLTQPDFEKDILPNIMEVTIYMMGEYTRLQSKNQILDYYTQGKLKCSVDFNTNKISFSTDNPLVKKFETEFIDLNDKQTFEYLTLVNAEQRFGDINYFTFGTPDVKDIVKKVDVMTFTFKNRQYILQNYDVVQKVLANATLSSETNPYNGRLNYFVEVFNTKARVNVVAIDKTQVESYSFILHSRYFPKYIYDKLTVDDTLLNANTNIEFTLKDGSKVNVEYEYYYEFLQGMATLEIDEKHQLVAKFKDTIIPLTSYKETKHCCILLDETEYTNGKLVNNNNNIEFTYINNFDQKEYMNRLSQINYQYDYNNNQYNLYFKEKTFYKYAKIDYEPIHLGLNIFNIEFLGFKTTAKLSLYDDTNRNDLIASQMEKYIIPDDLNPSFEKIFDSIQYFQYLAADGNYKLDYKGTRNPIKAFDKAGIKYRIVATRETDLGKDIDVEFTFNNLTEVYTFNCVLTNKLENIHSGYTLLEFNSNLHNQDKSFRITLDNYKDYLTDEAVLVEEYYYGYGNDKFTIKYRGQNLIDKLESFPHKRLNNFSSYDRQLSTSIIFYGEINGNKYELNGRFEIDFAEDMTYVKPQMSFDVKLNSNGKLMFDYYADSIGFYEQVKTMTGVDKYGVTHIYTGEELILLKDYIFTKIELGFNNDKVTVSAGRIEENTHVTWEMAYEINPNPVFKPVEIQLDNNYFYNGEYVVYNPLTPKDIAHYLDEVILIDRFKNKQVLTGKEKDDFIIENFTYSVGSGEESDFFVATLNGREFRFQSNVHCLKNKTINGMNVKISSRYIPKAFADSFTNKELTESLLKGIKLNLGYRELNVNFDSYDLKLLLDGFSVAKEQNGYKILYEGKEAKMMIDTGPVSGFVSVIKIATKMDSIFANVSQSDNFVCIDKTIINGNYDLFFDAINRIEFNASTINSITNANDNFMLYVPASALKKFATLDISNLVNGYNSIPFDILGLKGSLSIHLYYSKQAKDVYYFSNRLYHIIVNPTDNIDFLSYLTGEFRSYDGTLGKFNNGKSNVNGFSAKIKSIKELIANPEQNYKEYDVIYIINNYETKIRYKVSEYNSEYDLYLNRIDADTTKLFQQNIVVENDYSINVNNIYDYINNVPIYLSYYINGEFVEQKIVDGKAWLQANCTVDVQSYLDYDDNKSVNIQVTFKINGKNNTSSFSFIAHIR